MSKKVLFPPRGFICLTQYDTLEPTPTYIRCADISAITPVKLRATSLRRSEQCPVQYDRRGNMDGYAMGASIQYGMVVVSVTETVEQVIEAIKAACGE